jgi:ABC-type cobalamin/Fe3+-siderophores transport system ATPase subunit
VVLEDVNLVLRRGQFLVICGEVGAGKSTLLAALAQALPLSGGRVMVTGMYVCMYACTYVCIICMYVSYVCMYVCIIRMYVCMYACTYVYTYIHTQRFACLRGTEGIYHDGHHS